VFIINFNFPLRVNLSEIPIQVFIIQQITIFIINYQFRINLITIIPIFNPIRLAPIMLFGAIVNFHYINFTDPNNHDEYFLIAVITHLKQSLIHLFK